MSNDLLITPGSRKQEFKDSSGNVDAKIETDSNGNLLITNPGGDISIGDTTADIFVGDGVNNVDIVFEQDGEIRGTSGVNVTLGASGSNVRMATDLNLNSNDLTNVANLTATNLTLSSLSAQNSEATAVMINGSGVIGTRELGSNAFNSTTIPSLSGYATESYVTTQVNNLIDSAPGALNTLNELAAAIGDDSNFSTTVTNSIATKLPLAGGTLTGTLTTANSLKVDGIASSNSSPSTDDVELSGYGLIGNRGNVYITNSNASGQIVLGISGAHNANPKLTVTTSGITVAGTVSATGGNSTNWNTAYGWGNHASAGYVTSADGGNATTLDNLDSTQFFRNTSNIGSTSVDNLTTRGVYGNSSESSNQPFDNNAGTIIHLDGRDTNYKSQIFQYSANGAMWLRGKHGGSASWSSWFQVYDEQHKPTYSELGTMAYSNLTGTPTIPTNNNQLTNGASYITASNSAITNKLPLAGGTMTGVITSNDILVAANSHLQRSNHHSGHLEGSYNNVASNGSKSNPIYTIGSAYNPTDAALSNMYGIGFCKSNSSFITGDLDSGGASGWGLYVAADGDARVFLNSTDGTINSTGEHYADGNRVFHDSYHPNADTLTTARTIAGTSFNGSANIDISYNNLTNKPTIPTNNNQLTNGASYITASNAAITNKLPLAGGTITGAGTTALSITNSSGNGGYFNVLSNVGGVNTDGNVGLHVGWNKSNGGREVNMIFDGGTSQADTEMIFTSTDGSTYTDIFQINGGGNVDIKSGGLRIGTTTVIDSNREGKFSGGLVTSSTRADSGYCHPVGHYTTGEEVFSIDPTWTSDQLAEFFDATTTQVNWFADSTAPDGYAIKIEGGVSVGPNYGSGFPYISAGDVGDEFYMECYIRNHDSNQTHYMGGIEKNESFGAPSGGSGNPGSFGYWVMSNSNPGTSWTKVSGYIKNTGGSNTTGQFETGANYFVPMALFNYTSGAGTRTCYISGWKCFKVTRSGGIHSKTSADARPALIAENTGGIGSIIQKWVGDSDSMEFLNPSAGDYFLTNSQQNNGIFFADSTGGVSLRYNNADVLKVDSTGGMNLNTGGFKMAGTTIIQSGKNIVNIGAVTASGLIKTNSHIQAGNGSGGVALTINDGYGNANVTFNHLSGVPEQNGQAARIEVNTDGTSTAGQMLFEVSSSDVTSGSAVSLTSAMTINPTAVDFPQYVRHMGDTDTYMQFTANRVRIAAGGTVKFDSNNTYLTGITSSQVTTALGYTPPTAIAGVSTNADLRLVFSNAGAPQTDANGDLSYNPSTNLLNINGAFIQGPASSQVFSYAPHLSAASASIQLTFGRTTDNTGTGAIGADGSNCFAAWDTSGPTKRFEVRSGGDVIVPAGDLTVGSGSADTRILIKKADNNVSDHIQFYNGTTRVGEIGCEDTTWLRINQETNKNIYTPRYIRADNGFFVDGTNIGIDGTGNLLGIGTVACGAITSGGNSTFTGSGSSGNAFTVKRGSDSGNSLRIQNAGEVVVENNYLYAARSSGTGFYVQAGAVFRGGISNDTSGQPVTFNDDVRINGVINQSGKDIITSSGTSLTIGDVTDNDEFDSVLIKAMSGTSQINVGDSEMTLTGDVLVTENIRHAGDTHTRIQFTGDRIRLLSGNVEMLDLVEGGTDYVDIIDRVRVTAAGDMICEGDVVAFTSTTVSDINQKENIEVIVDPLEKVLKLKGVTFDWKKDKTKSAGIIAQDVEKVLPEIVKQKEDRSGEEFKSVDYNGVIGLLVEGMKEQQKLINRLEERIKGLENKGE